MSKIDISKYTQGKFIGKGAYGHVFICTHKKSKREFAAKVSILGAEEVDHIFNREIEALSHINHPCVIKLEGYSLVNFQGDKCPVLLTEFMPGGSLKRAIDAEFVNKPIDQWNNTKKQIIFIGMVAGLKALHDNNIIHRDFKPDNVLLDGSLHPHIIDFGLSKILDPKSSVNMSMYSGTASYMAPEILEESDFTYPVDVFALGVSIYELICGRPIYDRNVAIGKILRNVTSGVRPKVNHKCPEAFEKFIEACWDHLAENRITSEEAYRQVMTNKSLILPDVDVEEVRLYCRTFLKAEPKSVSNTKGRMTVRLPNVSTRSASLSQTTRSREQDDSTTMKTVKPRIPKRVPAKRKIVSDKIDEDEDEKHSSDKAKMKKDPELSSSDSLDRFSKSMSPSLMKRFSDSSFMSSINETMKTTLLKEDSDTLSTTISATKNEDFSLSTSISAKLPDISKIKLFQKPDPKMSAESLFLLGCIYENGYHGKGMNFTKAAAFYKAAADKGHASAMFNYGNFLRDGVGVDEDAEEAVKYLTKAANAGCVEATVNLGRMIEDGEGCEKNPAKALSWYEKGAKAGQTLGYLNAGRLCLLGDEKTGLKPNLKKAETYLKKACEKDDSGIGPKLLISVLYFMTDEYDKGIPYAKEIADQDLAPAQFLYALMITEKKPSEAADYLERAANGGFEKAMFILGNMYYRGDGVDKDFKKAADWFRSSAESGDSDGELRYGMCLLEGEGVEEDCDEAARYIRKSCESGNPKAPLVLVLITLILKKVPMIESDANYILKGLAIAEKLSKKL